MTNNDKSPTKIIIIDTTQKDTTQVGLLLDGELYVDSQAVMAQQLLEIIEKLLTAHHLDFQNIEALAVLTGPGSFTGTRIGAVVASTANFLTHAKLIEIEGSSFETACDKVKSGEFKFTDRITIKYQ